MAKKQNKMEVDWDDGLIGEGFSMPEGHCMEIPFNVDLDGEDVDATYKVCRVSKDSISATVIRDDDSKEILAKSTYNRNKDGAIEQDDEYEGEEDER